ncbi:hypothetical protein JN403_01050 [Pseudomonas sp. 15A4]|uniref:hypothetical protein n=1 Tax=Pseudomonas sp. 15A4 TaxID=2804761 RepID=UPI0019685DDF|nr:hypothetical protein [Pseudomonas sp. 15A4]QSB19715.1 hypothetical protein JN403_01050 [Pseudomonas sp. 15A4]
MLRLKALLVCFFVMTITSCATVDRSTAPFPPQQTPSIQEDLGQQVVRHLTTRYADVRSNCGTDSQPAFLCSGVTIRGTASNPTYHVWNNSPASLAKGGVSLSYLRADSKFEKLAYGYTNGYIFNAYFYAGNQIHPEVLCFFPIDAGTVNRAGKGCGAYPGFAGSGPCHLQGVDTAANFWTHYNAHSDSRHSYQCGFDVTDGRNTLAGPAFAAGVGAMKLMGAESFGTQNEFIMAAWADGLGKTLPLEAFFYLNGTDGLSVAQRNQRDLKATDGRLIPIINVKLSRSTTDPATFYYLPADQTEPMPPAT